jgi:hypothetical protein
MSILVLTSDTLIGTAATGNIEYNGQFFGTDSAAARAQIQRITLGTAVASTSGTSIDFTSIPSWVKRITVMFLGVSTSGSSVVQIQLGAGSVTTTGYLSSGVSLANTGTVVGATQTTGFGVEVANGNTSASSLRNGHAVITLITGTTWVNSSNLAYSNTGFSAVTGGNLALGGTLDRVRITTVNGTDTFDAGSVNILYEG